MMIKRRNFINWISLGVIFNSIFGCNKVATQSSEYNLDNCYSTQNFVSQNELNKLKETVHYNPKAFGAVGNGITDDASAIQKAINTIMTNGGGSLYFPPGDYVIKSQISTSIDLGNGWEKGLSIFGAGRGTTVIRIQNSTGFFKWVLNATRNINFSIKNLTAIADNGGNAGTFVHLEQIAGGVHQYRDLVADDVMGIGQDRDTDYFDKFFYCFALHRPYFSNVTSTGSYGPNANETEKLQGTAVFDVPECYAPTFVSCYAWGGDYAYRHLTNENPGSEDGKWDKCVANNCKVGFYISSPGIEPGLTIKDCHANANEANIRINGKKYGHIINNLLYNETLSRFTDINLINCEDIVLENNIYHFPKNINRTMVNVDKTSTRIFIQNEKFRCNGTAINLESGANEIYIERPWFNSEIDSQIVDNAGEKLFVIRNTRLFALTSLSANQSILESNNIVINFDNEVYDIGSWFDSKTPGRFTVPSNKGIRWVRVTANITWASDSKGYRFAKIHKNNAPFLGTAIMCQPAQQFSNMQLFSNPIPVDDGDYIEIIVKQTSGNSLDVLSTDGTTFYIEAVDG